MQNQTVSVATPTDPTPEVADWRARWTAPDEASVGALVAIETKLAGGLASGHVHHHPTLGVVAVVQRNPVYDSFAVSHEERNMLRDRDGAYLLADGVEVRRLTIQAAAKLTTEQASAGGNFLRMDATAAWLAATPVEWPPSIPTAEPAEAVTA